VAAVHLQQLEGRNVPHPQEQGQFRLSRIVGELAGDLDVRFLEHVGIVHAARQSATEPQFDHSLEPGALRAKQGAQSCFVAVGGPPHQSQGFLRLDRLLVPHTSLSANAG
jgi:hypothetical protein